MVSRPEITVPVDSVAARSLEDPSLYVSRELSWLEFNDRVLEEALDESNPLLERLKFIAIYGTNLDEYFMIRISALKQQVEAEIHFRSDDGKLPEEHLSAISKHLRISLKRQMACLHEDLFPALERYGIRIFRYESLDEATRASLQRMYNERVFPILTPLAIDRGHPFPYISNLSLSLAVELEEESPDGPITHFARVKVPNGIPRFVPIDSAPEGQHWYVYLEDLIAHNLDALFPGMTIRASYLFRVTRDADLILQEDEAGDRTGAAQAPLRRAGPPRGGRRDAATRALQAPGSALTLGLGLLRVRGDARDVRSVGARQPRYPGAARSAVHTVDPAQARRCDRYLRGHPRGRHPAAAPL